MCQERFPCSPSWATWSPLKCICDTRLGLCFLFIIHPALFFSASIAFSSHPDVFSNWRGTVEGISPSTSTWSRQSARNPRLASFYPQPYHCHFFDRESRCSAQHRGASDTTSPALIYIITLLGREGWAEFAVTLALHLLRHWLILLKGFCHVQATSSTEVLLPQAHKVLARDKKATHQ